MRPLRLKSAKYFSELEIGRVYKYDKLDCQFDVRDLLRLEQDGLKSVSKKLECFFEQFWNKQLTMLGDSKTKAKCVFQLCISKLDVPGDSEKMINVQIVRLEVVLIDQLITLLEQSNVQIDRLEIRLKSLDDEVISVESEVEYLRGVLGSLQKIKNRFVLALNFENNLSQQIIFKLADLVLEQEPKNFSFELVWGSYDNDFLKSISGPLRTLLNRVKQLTVMTGYQKNCQNVFTINEETKKIQINACKTTNYKDMFKSITPILDDLFEYHLDHINYVDGLVKISFPKPLECEATISQQNPLTDEIFDNFFQDSLFKRLVKFTLNQPREFSIGKKYFQFILDSKLTSFKIEGLTSTVLDLTGLPLQIENLLFNRKKNIAQVSALKSIQLFSHEVIQEIMKDFLQDQQEMVKQPLNSQRKNFPSMQSKTHDSNQLAMLRMLLIGNRFK